ncbi:MAG: pentapeptide repeat-containing protein [Thermodesulfobacteriota bacterium]
MLDLKSPLLSGVPLFFLVLTAGSLHGAPLGPTPEVQVNIDALLESKSCPQCDLSGSDLSRMDLSGANLQGADLSRAKMFLTDLSEANLQNCDLRGAAFGGADLGNADLRGADLTGASLAGAYLSGALLDGEMVSTTPYAKDAIADVEEKVYVDDTVKPKSLPETENVTIASRRDFEETPPAVPDTDTPLSQPAPQAEVQMEEKEIDDVIPQSSVAAPATKTVPTIQAVHIEEEVAEKPPLLLADEKKKIAPKPSSIEKERVNEEPAAEDSGAEESADVVVSEDPVAEVIRANQADVAEEQAPVPEPQASRAAEEEVPAMATDSAESQAAAIPEEVVQTGGDDGGAEADESSEQSLEGAVQDVAEVVLVAPQAEVLKNIELLLDTNRCYGCNLAGADLSDENLDEADLEGADLSNANLREADLEGANLKGANLSGANLSGADLSEADLYRAVLSNADLSEANLEDTLLDDADLSGVKGYQQNILILENQ